MGGVEGKYEDAGEAGEGGAVGTADAGNGLVLSDGGDGK